MKRVLRSLLLRLLRASGAEGPLVGAVAVELKRKIAELECELAAVREFRDPAHASNTDETVDHIASGIPIDGSAIAPQNFAAACAAYSMLRTMGARERVSEHLLRSLLAADTSAPELLSATADRLALHELYRQAAATHAFASGLIEESARGWKQISDDVPSPFNLACYARALLAGDEKRQALSVLMDGVDRYPRNVMLAVELAEFFVRLGDTDAANAALEAVRHAFLDERSALTQQRAELDRDIDQGRLADRGYGGNEPSPVADLWQGQRRQLASTEFQNPLAARDAAIRRLIRRIIEDSKGSITTVVEFGTFCADTLVRLARDTPQIQFIGVGNDETTALNSRLTVGGNLRFERGNAASVLSASIAGADSLLFHAGIENSTYPAKLAQLYGRCRELGSGHLVISEPLDFDRDNLRYHEPGLFPRITLLGGQGRFLHDFKKLLDDAAYNIVETTNARPVLIPAIAARDSSYRLLHAVPRH